MYPWCVRLHAVCIRACLMTVPAPLGNMCADMRGRRLRLASRKDMKARPACRVQSSAPEAGRRDLGLVRHPGRCTWAGLGLQVHRPLTTPCCCKALG